MQTGALEDPKEYTGHYREVLALGDPHKSVEFFDNQAKVYDQTMSTLGFTDPAVIKDYFEESGIPKDAPVLEFACGTGLVGEQLAKAGYNAIVGIDGCDKMLIEAKKKVRANVLKLLIGMLC